MSRKRGNLLGKSVVLFAVTLIIGLLGNGTMEKNELISHAAQKDTKIFANVSNNRRMVCQEVTTGTAVTGAVINGWVQENQKWHYYDNGVLQEKKAGWYQIKNRYYYLKADGSRVEKEKGFYYIGNKWYYISADGKRISKAKGWYKISDKYYYSYFAT